MTLAIMQPYLFPYLGYFQLISATDLFVMYDDVAFERRGWINRNRLLDPASGEPFWLTVPVRTAPRGTPISAMEIHGRARWQKRLLRRIETSYRGAPQFDVTWPLVESALGNPEANLSAFVSNALRLTCSHLGIDTPLISSQRRYRNSELRGEQRLIDICRREGAGKYLNAEGGRELYKQANFNDAGMTLQFLEHRETPYPQSGSGFVPRLSIIDAMMHNGPQALRELLTHYRVS